MAKPGYPGLVQVPPSDRSILRRRLAKWAFLILSVIGGLSALNIWLPSSGRTRDCQFETEAAGTAYALRQDCSQTTQTIAAPPAHQTEMLVSQRSSMEVPKRVGPVQSRASNPVIAATPPKRPIDQSPAQSTKAGQAATTSPENSGSNAPNRIMASSQDDESAGGVIDSPPTMSHTSTHANPDVLLAEQGDAFAQYRLGRFYAQQSGLHSPESVNWYMKASDGLRRLASAGNGKAMYVLGVMYAFGRGVVQNREEARSWLAQAVAHQVPAAGPVLASLEKYRPADSNPPMNMQAKRRQT